MGWLKKIPRISLFLLLLTYGVFGWLYSEWTLPLSAKLSAKHELVSPLIAQAALFSLGLLSISIAVSYFTSPISLLTLGMSNWFRADAKALLTIALSIVVFAIIIEHPVALTRFLILSSAAMLFRLDLQTSGCSQKSAQIIIIFVSAIAFSAGLLLFYSHSNL